MTGVIRWHNDARACIAPRVPEDVGLGRHWHHTMWTQVQQSLKWANNAHAEEPALTTALVRVLALTEEPKSLSDDEMDIFLGVLGALRSAEYLARVFGTLRVVERLLAPGIEHVSSGSGYVIKRIGRKVDGKILRNVLIAERDATVRAKCRERAQVSWDDGDVEVHQHLAYAFHDDEAWRQAALSEIVVQAPKFESMQLALVRDVDTMRSLVARSAKTDPIAYPELVAALGEDALPLLLELVPLAHGNARRTSHALALSVIANEPAAKHLAKCISHPATRAIIGEYFKKHETLAAAVLPAASQGASRNAALAKELLIEICGDQTTDAKGDLVALADPAVPAVLRDAPWKKPPPALPNLGLDVATWPSSVVIEETKKAALEAFLVEQRLNKPFMTDDEVNAYLEAIGKSSVWAFVREEKAVPLETVLHLFNAGRWQTRIEGPMLAAFGDRALPGVRRSPWLEQLSPDVRDAIDDAGIAVRLALDWLAMHNVWSWFAAHPRAAAFGLLSAVHQPSERRACELALRRLSREGHRDTILSFVPKDHESVVREFLERDPRLDVPPVAKEWKQKLQVQRARLRDGRALDDETLGRVYEMLAFSTVHEPYAGIDDVRQACDARSLAEMTWDLATFADGGARSRRWRQDDLDWMRWSLAHFANDEVIRRLTPALKHQTIYRVLERLAIAGSRPAAMELATAFDRGDSTHSLDFVAKARGTTRDELVETLLPTTPLADEGTTPLEYGSRALRVGFDTTLAPILFLEEKRLAALPRAKATDDPIAVRLARERWDELKEDVRTIARLRCRALQDAMRQARRISAKHFLTTWAAHPLGKHQARGMVWAVERDGGLVTFRVAEDSSLANVDDAPLVLADTEFVRVPHLAELDAKTANTWTQTMNDYGLIQPVAQLARTPLATTREDEARTKITRELSTPVAYTAFERVLADQGVSRVRPMTRMQGVAQMNTATKWINSKTMCTSVELTFRNGQDMLTLSQVDPVERGESLYLLRIALEAT